MTNNDENVVRTRLLLDGDGTGDDRRLNNIAKMVSSTIMFQTFLISFKPLLRILITSFIVRLDYVVEVLSLCDHGLLGYLRPHSSECDVMSCWLFSFWGH